MESLELSISNDYITSSATKQPPHKRDSLAHLLLRPGYRLHDATTVFELPTQVGIPLLPARKLTIQWVSHVLFLGIT